MVWSENMRIFNAPHLKNTDESWMKTTVKCQKCTASSQTRIVGQVDRNHHHHYHHHHQHNHHQQQLHTQPTKNTRAHYRYSNFSNSHALAICAAITILFLSRDNARANAQSVAEGKLTTNRRNTYNDVQQWDIGTSEENSDADVVQPSPSWVSLADETSCYFVAAPGLFFNRSVLAEIHRREDDPLKDDDFVKVYFMESQLDDWMIYQEETQLLQGVPNSDYIDAPTQNFVIALYRNNSAIRSVSCSIDVTNDVSEYDENAVKSGSASLRCASYEPITVFSLTLSPRARLSKRAKLRVFQSLCRLIQNKIISCNSIVIEEAKEANKMTRLVQSSRSRSADKRAEVVEVWWPIACGSDSLSPSTFSDVSKSADNGSLAEILGVDIYNWNIGNRVDDKARYAAKSLRIGQKRHFSKMFRSSRTSVYEFDTIRMKRSDLSSSGDDDSVITYNERTTTHEGTSKPSLSHLQSPTVAPTSAGTPVARASIPSDHDNPPFVNLHDLTLQGSVGTLMKFKLPGNTFYDKEDGGIEKLALSVIHITEDGKVETESWLRVDKKTLTLYGVPPESSTNAEGKFLLQATDSSLFTATTRIKISISPRKRSKTNHRFVVSSIYHDTKLTKEIQASIWMRLLSKFLFPVNGKDLPTNPPEDRLTLIKHDRGDRRITMTWTDNELISQGKCDMRKINQMWRQMTGERSVSRKSSDRRVRASENFSDFFEPAFTVDKVKVALSGTCSSSSRSHATTRPRTLAVTPVTASTLPTIVASISVPQVLQSKSWQMTLDMGFLTKMAIDTSDFYLPDMTYFKLVPVGPSWIRVDNEHRQLVALPHANSFPKTVNFKAQWNGGLVASIGNSDSDPLNISVTAMRYKVDSIEGDASLKFQLDILNYDIETFKVKEFGNLLGAIQEMYNDTDTSNIYVYAPTSATGTLEISWTNVTTAVGGACQEKLISRICNVLIASGNINRKFEMLLEAAGFEVGSIRMVRLHQCSKTTPQSSTTAASSDLSSSTTLCSTESTKKTTELTVTPTPTARSQQAANRNNVNKNPIDSTTVRNDVKAKQSGASSTILIIMVTLLVCALLLLALCCYSKFRTRKVKEVRTTLGGKLSLGTGGRDFTYKRGTPIVFDGELDNNQEMREMNGTSNNVTNHPSTSPLLNDRVIQQNQTSSFFQSAAPKSQKDDAIIDLTLQSANSGVPSEIERPPPPPYLLKSVGAANGYDH